MRNIPTVLGASALLLLGTTTTALGQYSGADASCQPVQATLNAFDRSGRFRATGSMTGDGKSYPYERIAVADTLYIGSQSRWMKAPQTPVERLKADAEGGWTFSGCRRVGSEFVHADPATIYEAHMASKNQKTQQHVRIWISVRSGLPLRMDSEAPQGNLKTSMLFTYGADIRAPAVP